MGREGPCWHCGITHTPLWRNGPLEKPVLCNACGSRYRLKGTLEDYTPKHAQIVEGEAVVPTRRTRKRNSSSADATLTSSHDHKGRKPTSSSSPLKKKNQERAAILEKIWKSGIPSRKRSSVSCRKLTATKRFQMELSYALKNGVEDSAILSQEHEEEDHVLINNANNVIISPNEIGIGCILLKENTNIISSSTEKSSDNKHTPSILEYLNGSHELNDPQTGPPPPTLTL